MSRRRLRRLGFVAAALAALATAAGVFAFWSAGGAGTGTATAGTLNAPTGVTATASGSTVTVSWTAPASPSVAPTGYYVTRSNGSMTAAACGSSASSLLAASPTHCDDTGVSTGSYMYTVVAVYRSWTAASSASAAVNLAALDHFAVTAPSTAQAGTAFSVTVAAKDASNNTITTYAGTVHFTSSDTGSPALPSDYTFVAGDSGSHTFANAVTLKTAGSQSVAVNDTVQTTATGSASVSVSAAAASKLAFTVQPSAASAGASITPAPQVTVQDSFGNAVTSSSVGIAVAIGTNPSGGTLSGTKTVSAVNGVATFPGLSVDKAGTGYTLTASGSALTGATSSSFNVTNAGANKLVFTVQPTSTTAGQSITPAPQITVEDANGNTVTSSSASITVAIGTNPSGGTLSGTKTVSAVNGVATFPGLSIDRAGSGYTLAASGSGLTSDTSSAFAVTAAAASKLAFSVQPSAAAAGAAITPAPQVTIQDQFGNTVTSSAASITVAIGTNPSGGTLSGTKTVSAVSGVATFGGLSIDKAGTGYTLTAASSGLTAATSSSFNVGVAGATKLVFTVQPSNTAAGASITPAPQVTVEDASGNVVTSSNASITLAIGTNPATGTLSGTKTVSAVNGVATFSGLSIDKPGTGYTLTAAGSGLTGDTSSSFNVTVGAASKLAFTVQPSTTAAGASIAPAPQVTVQDAAGNTVTSSTASITLAIGTNPSSGTLSGTKTVNAVNGVATFGGLSIDKVGTSYTLTAAGSGLTGDTSSSFNITVGASAKLAFTVQPSNTAAGASITPAPQVTVQDAAGNTVTSSTASITLAIGTNPSSGTLSGTKTVSAINGVATFSGLSIDKPGTGYTLSASATSLTGATSSAFSITAAAATKLGWVIVSTNTTATATGCPFACSYGPGFGNNNTWSAKVGLFDNAGNAVSNTGGAVTVTVTLGGTGNGTLTGGSPQTLSVANGSSQSAGQVTFTGGSGQTWSNTLTASASGLANATASFSK